MPDDQNNPPMDLSALAAALSGNPVPGDVPPPNIPASAIPAAQPETQMAPMQNDLQAPATPPIVGGLSSNQQPSGPPAFGGLPLLARYIMQMSKPQGQTISAPGFSYQEAPRGRGDMTLDFLGQFLGNLSQGLAASGHGPGAGIRGFSAAMMAPYQRSLQQYQLGQQQQLQEANIAQEQAKTQAAVQSYTAQPRFDPQSRQYLGTMTDPQFTSYLRGAGAAQAKAGSDSADVEAELDRRAQIRRPLRS